MIKAPIGVFDSGVGGITVLRHLITQFPQESFDYLADTANLPYGDKDSQTLVELVRPILRFLVNKGAKCIVMACNTSSAIALPKLASEFQIPLFGVVVPGALEAVKITKNGRIGVMANHATVKSNFYPAILSKVAKDCGKIVISCQSACPRLVPLIENGSNEANVDKILREYLFPLLENDIDTIILGCTHYPLLQDKLIKLVGPFIKFIDPAIPTTVSIKDWLQKNEWLQKEENHQEVFKKVHFSSHISYIREPVCRFWTTGKPDFFNARAEALLGRAVAATQVFLEDDDLLPCDVEKQKAAM